jgi:hypothetical protein
VKAVLVSNGPGELYTWVKPVLTELRRQHPDVKVNISLIPCQFASGNEARIAQTFGADSVATPADYLRFMTLGQAPAALGDARGFVLSLGGNTGMALRLGRKLSYPVYRYSFEPYWHPGLRRLFVHDERAERHARMLGAPRGRLERIGNLVADAVELAQPVRNPGTPHVLLIPGSRDGFAIHLIPFMIALADELGSRYPQARFVWPVSRLLSEQTVAAGIQGLERATLGGVAGQREGDTVITPRGYTLELVPEHERYAHMRAADLAVTIPGTNTLELGVAGVPSIVVLPLNKPEAIPLEGPGHWLSLLPFVGVPLKRQAVRLFVERLSVPVSLPNRFSGEPLMVEVKGRITLEQVAAEAVRLLDNEAERARIRERLQATMPPAGAATKLIESIMTDFVDNLAVPEASRGSAMTRDSVQ